MYSLFNARLEEIKEPKDVIIDAQNEALVFVHKKPTINDYDITEFDRIVTSLRRKKYDFSVRKQSDPL